VVTVVEPYGSGAGGWTCRAGVGGGIAVSLSSVRVDRDGVVLKKQLSVSKINN
jgi:hypothetical protein